ncbi:MAG: phage scaffolding protein, partial [Actinobacteria bacterium]|nr:phage scaffolding protein [Actinomycetota bacterium]
KGPSKDDLVRTQREVQRQVEREIAKAEQAERRRAAALISAVPSALEEAGWNGRNMPRMLKLLDLDSVEVDSDGDIEGLQDQIDELKKDFPEFFKRQRMKEAAKEVADTKTVGGGKKTAPASEETLDFATRLKMQLMRGQ